MPKGISFDDRANDLPLHEWAGLLRLEAEDLVKAASLHESDPTMASRYLVIEALDDLESIIASARRRLNR